MATERDIPSEDVIDGDGNDPAAVQERLNRVHDILTRVNFRLLDIEARWVGPGPPGQPAMVDVLTRIGTESLRAKSLADALIGRQHDIHATNGLFGVIHAADADAEQLRPFVTEFFSSLRIAAGDEYLFNRSHGEHSFENPESVSADAE